MNTPLQTDFARIIDILNRTVEISQRYYTRQNTMPPSRNVHELPEMSLPEQGMGAEAVLTFFEDQHADHMANSAGPRYFGFVTGGSTPASVAGDWLVSVYDQVMSGSNDSVAHALERQTIGFLKDLFGLGAEFSGTFVTGATMSNFVSLATGRQWVGQQYGLNIAETGVTSHIPFKVVSGTPHSSILKSLSMLGLGRQAWVQIGTLPDREAIDVTLLEEFLKHNSGPVIVVANAGTVNSVDFDDLIAIAELKSKYQFFLHVDAAFGGFAAASPLYKHFVKGIEMADTVTIDAHKWLNVPYDSAMQFTRHKTLQIEVFKNNAAYLGDPNVVPDSMHITPENSRRFRALPAWFSLMAYGRIGYQEIVERNCSEASHLGSLIGQSTNFKLLAPVRMNVVCFTLARQCSMPEIQKFLNLVRDDGRVFFTPTNYKGVPAIRAAISNWKTSFDDIELGFKVLNEVCENIFASATEVND